ncbi:hypothetical protein L4D76_11975 [Photobacterium sagamiensis]|uniref:hypothetical protein n=1 Tax=Photobacterium sagamiensis TaxID=2910241 RepID=UPI003D0BF255
MQLMIEQLNKLKNAWMASHVTDAEYPTPLSEKGLSLYQARQQQLSSQLISSIPDCATSSLSFYPVDCHPLTIRYSLVLASQWADEADTDALIEYLTQIMFEQDAPAQLYVGFFKGKPAACGMIYHHQSDKGSCALIADVHSLPLANQQTLQQEMENYLLNKAKEDHDILVLTK